MTKSVDLDDKLDLATLVEEMSRSADHAILRKGGKDVAVILSTEAYQRLVHEQETDFAVFDRIDRAMREVDPETLERDIAEAVEEVKTLRRQQMSNA